MLQKLKVQCKRHNVSLEWDATIGDKPSEVSSASELKVAELSKLFPKLDKVRPRRSID